MRMYDIIAKKRDGNELTDEEIRYFVKAVSAESVPDYETSALLMAMFIRGLNERETATLTDAMAYSGDTVDLSRFGNLSVDKHSTGGVGDKTSLIVAPIVAAAGAVVAKMSGRGLGHTGGTVDKLESIPGYNTSLSPDEFLAQAEKCSLALVGQSGDLAPADKKLYALRDVTATVNSIPLICSSIMSKKIAAGSKNIVLDVKVGSGAFMKTPEDAETLAREMVKLGKLCGRNIAALITDMDSPLGYAVGNSLEVAEAVSVLKGETDGDLLEVSSALATEMLSLALEITADDAVKLVDNTLKNGSAFAKMKEWVALQGGDTDTLDNTSLLPAASIINEVRSSREGYITAMDAEIIGTASMILGAGRKAKDDVIDHGAGIIIKAKVGDYVRIGDVLCVLHTNRAETVAEAAGKYLSAISTGDEKPIIKPLIYKTIR